MRTNIFLILFMISAIIACDQKFETRIPPRGEVNLRIPLSRQMTYYQAFRYICGADGMLPLNDTIILSVLNEDGRQFFIEQGTLGSESEEVRTHFAQYPFVTGLGILTISDREDSWLFRYVGNDVFDTRKSVLNNRLTQRTNCRLTDTSGMPFVGDGRGLATSFTLDSNDFEDIFVVCSDFETPLPGYMVYDSMHLHYSYDSSEFRPNEVYGWRRVPR